MNAAWAMEHHAPHIVPAAEVRRRVDLLQARMRADGPPLVWVDHLADRLWLSGSAQDGVLLLPADGDPRWFVRKSRSRAALESPFEARPWPGRRGLVEEVARLAGSGRRLGLALDASRAVTYALLQQGVDGLRIEDAAPAIRQARAVKSPWEVEQIRRACAQVTALYGEIAAAIRPGMSELALTGKVEGRLRELGHGGTVRVRQPAADIAMGVVVAGPSGRVPTAFNGPVGAPGPYPPTASGAGTRRLVAGESVMLDLVTSYNGYHGDNTRTFCVGGEPPEDVQRAHAFCRDMLRELERRMRPGAVCSQIFREVAALARERGEPPGFMGHGENRVRFFGHGVGLELDELPVIAEKIDMALAPGSVLAVEPKAFPDGGPAGIENTYVVGEDGCESLCTADERILPTPA
jgi:Xaa-Pro aminopeptidase